MQGGRGIGGKKHPRRNVLSHRPISLSIAIKRTRSQPGSDKQTVARVDAQCRGDDYAIRRIT